MKERRFPLLIGLRAFRLLAIVPAWLLFVAALSLTLYLVGPDLPYGNTMRLWGFVGVVLAMCLFLSPFALLFAAKFVFGTIRRAISNRACDVVMDETGIRILGGQAHGFSASWESLAHPHPCGVRWVGQELWLRGGENRWLRVPLPPDADERTSLEALFATVSAYAASSGQKNATPKRRSPPGTLLCLGCGAPQAPAETPSVCCRHCNTTNPIPPELTEKIRAMRKVAEERAGDDALVSAVVGQRGARVANLVAFVGGLLMMAASVVTLLVTAAFAFVDGKEAGLPRGGGIGIVAAGMGLLLLAAVRLILANRRALRLLTVGFSAHEPEREGDPRACRECDGPLPEPPGHSAVARCVYCSAVNVMAADLRLEASIVQRFAALAKDPREVLAANKKQRRRASIVALLGILMILGGAFGLYSESRVSAIAGAKDAVEIPFNEAEKPTYLGAVLPGPGALRVERMAELGEKTPWILPDGKGGVTPVVPREVLAKLPLSKSWYADTLVMDIAPFTGGAFLATMRASEQGHLRIRRIEPDGSTAVLMHDAREPMPSPDGKQLVAARLFGENFHLVIASAERLDTPKQLTRGYGQEAFPVWSPDGKRIAFLTRTVRDVIQFHIYYGHSHLWVMDADGRNAERLTLGVSLEMVRPVWTEQGVWVVGREMTRRDGSTTVLWKVVPRER